MPSISITVEGLDDAINGINQVIQDMSTTKRNALQNVSDFFVQELKFNAHVISGDMKNSVRSQQVTDSQYLVEVGAPYAAYENRRKGNKGMSVLKGPHDFADRAERATRDMFSSIMATTYGNMFHAI